MKEVDDKSWMGIKPDNRRMSELLETWWNLHGHTLKSGKHEVAPEQLLPLPLFDSLSNDATQSEHGLSLFYRIRFGRKTPLL